MKKSFILVITLLQLTACKKNETSNVAANSWNVGNESYSVKSTFVQRFYTGFDFSGFGFCNTVLGQPNESYILKLELSKVDSVKSGLYKIVDYPSIFGNEISLHVYQDTAALYARRYDYRSTGNDNVFVSIINDGGQLVITIPKTWVKQGNDSVQVSAPSLFLHY